MMESDPFFELAFSRYLSSLKAGTASTYDCLRFFQNSFRYALAGEEVDEWIRVAALKLIQDDPFFLISDAHGQFVDGLSEDDIQACVNSWSLEDEQLAAFLEGHLRMTAVSGYAPDPLLVRGALAALEKALPGFGDQKEFLKLYTRALQILGDERYEEAFDALLKKTDPEWWAHDLKSAMSDAVDRENWARYDDLRNRWGEMPANAHLCECYLNYVANIDGLRSLERGDHEDAIRCLHVAVDVRGCPHLNSGGGEVLLANELLDRGLAREEVREHLGLLEKFCETEETGELRRRLAH